MPVIAVGCPLRQTASYKNGEEGMVRGRITAAGNGEDAAAFTPPPDISSPGSYVCHEF